jgi:hypothetical protein
LGLVALLVLLVQTKAVMADHLLLLRLFLQLEVVAAVRFLILCKMAALVVPVAAAVHFHLLHLPQALAAVARHRKAMRVAVA